MTFDDLLEVLRGVEICFWDGAAPCPKCGGSHSAPPEKEDDRLHAQIRFAIEHRAKERYPKAFARWIEEMAP